MLLSIPIVPNFCCVTSFVTAYSEIRSLARQSKAKLVTGNKGRSLYANRTKRT